MSKRLVRSSFLGLGVVELCLFVVSLTLVLSGSPVNAYVAPVTNDLWDISNGAQVTNTSGVYPGSDIRDMFGGSFSITEAPGRTIFKDGLGSGYTHFVEWQTPTAILLTGFNLLAAHDGGTRDVTYRGFRDFYLKALIGGSWQTIYSYNVSGSTYNPSSVNGLMYNELGLYVTGLNVTAQQFMAEFVQAGNVANAQGPRVIELDGFGAPVPVPPAVYLLGAGLVGLLGLRRRFTNYLKK